MTTQEIAKSIVGEHPDELIDRRYELLLEAANYSPAAMNEGWQALEDAQEEAELVAQGVSSDLIELGKQWRESRRSGEREPATSWDAGTVTVLEEPDDGRPLIERVSIVAMTPPTDPPVPAGWRLVTPPLVAAIDIRARVRRLIRPTARRESRGRRMVTAAGSRGSPARPRQAADDDPPLVRRLRGALARLLGGWLL